MKGRARDETCVLREDDDDTTTNTDNTKQEELPLTENN